MGTFLIDLSRAPGRALFAKAINGVLDQFDPAAVQYLPSPHTQTEYQISWPLRND
jgi:hypothetical protein